MHSRLLVSSLFALCTLASVSSIARAQDAGDHYADGLVPGNYLRLGAGVTSPIRPAGSLRDWDRGSDFAIAYENWSPGGAGVSSIGYGLSLDYSRLPLNESQFLSSFTPVAGVPATSASASPASTFLIGTNVRFRIPAPFVMPSISVAFSYIDFRPATINYTAPSGNGATSQEHRRGAAFSVGAGLDRHIYDRVGIFGEAVYTYGFTSLGYGIANPRGNCAANGCDVLKNTTIGVIRGGLRLRVTR